MYIGHHLTSAELRKGKLACKDVFCFILSSDQIPQSVVNVPNLFLAFAFSSVCFHTFSNDDVLRTK